MATYTPREQINDRQRAYLATITPTGPVIPLSEITTLQQIKDYAAAGHTVSKQKTKVAPDGSALARQWIEATYMYWMSYYNPLSFENAVSLARAADHAADKAYALAGVTAPAAGSSGNGTRTPADIATPTPVVPPPLQYQGASFGKWALILGGLIAAGMILGKNKKFAKLPVISLFAGGKKSRRRSRRRR